MQYRFPVGGGPSGNTCPRCDSHRPQRTSVRCIPDESSARSSIASGAGLAYLSHLSLLCGSCGEHGMLDCLTLFGLARMLHLPISADCSMSFCHRNKLVVPIYPIFGKRKGPAPDEGTRLEMQSSRFYCLNLPINAARSAGVSFFSASSRNFASASEFSLISMISGARA